MLDYYLKLENAICKSQVRVVMYHRIGYEKEYPWLLKPTPVEYFEKQLDYICKNFHVLSVDQLVGYFLRKECPPRRSVLLTFDDGYKDNYVFAFPLFNPVISLPYVGWAKARSPTVHSHLLGFAIAQPNKSHHNLNKTISRKRYYEIPSFRRHRRHILFYS